jgi:predicted NBD/HSP70 family sugar kinase
MIDDLATTFGDAARLAEALRAGVAWAQREAAGHRVLGISAAASGLVADDGVMRVDRHLGVADFDLARVLAPVTDLPVFIDAETRLYLRHALLSPAHAHLRNAVALSPLMGGYPGPLAIVVDGTLYRGADGTAGRLCAGPAADAERESERRFAARVEALGGRDRYFALLKQDAPAAVALYESVIAAYGRQVAQAANLLNPQAILLYTPYNDLGERLLADIRRAMSPHCPAPAEAAVPLLIGGSRCERARLQAATTAVVTEFLDHGDLALNATAVCGADGA